MTEMASVLIFSKKRLCMADLASVMIFAEEVIIYGRYLLKREGRHGRYDHLWLKAG
jgi:hypothetical protein